MQLSVNLALFGNFAKLLIKYGVALASMRNFDYFCTQHKQEFS